jgi:hypothetical protein
MHAPFQFLVIFEGFAGLFLFGLERRAQFTYPPLERVTLSLNFPAPPLSLLGMAHD